ncbi:hypothetical protein BCR41DRAFT_45847 [Lobosporangium transversale]|uniref:Uncharacterized protein n=1 Tax=Lobosporangium transversale TaxID=64571 RepID=A0A1Y2GQ30_9FUNG|nr:hypothetical protein BCR41DRAFT_45847 [Lobosporangium transversale]ORZ18348.1 hypothetical protein BCR41DRAFT_45847 [Lobosporangium transversale]|eukprot:XP_021882143.1 hypothetical protein BCR41DRAFT_45847 [Lobosporangium transversale]
MIGPHSVSISLPRLLFLPLPLETPRHARHARCYTAPQPCKLCGEKSSSPNPSSAYTIMLIFYMTQGADVFTQHAQALDLCIRLTPCPIFSLPPPPFLIKYFESKCGRPARDNNPSTIIEEGITSDPRPRRPPMLVSYPTSFTSRRGSGYPFDHHSDHGERRSLGTYSPYASYDREDGDQFKLFIEGETYIGTNSTLGTTAAEASPKMKALSMASTSTQKDIDSSTVGAGKADNTVPKSLSIPTLPPLESSPMSSSPTKPTQHAHTPVLIFAAGYTPDRDEDEEAAEAARKISRRLTMEGRKDELDIFNISSMMKWPYRPSSTMPALRSSSTTINSTTTSGSKHPRPPLPALLTGSSLFRPNRNSTNENHDRDPSVPASGLEKKFHNSF